MPDQRIQFAKTERARYISHLDLMRTFQRAFLRAGIEARHTEGFNPHTYVSIPLPLSVGFSSTCEILEFGLIRGSTKEELPERLTAVLPEGITVFHCYDAVRPYKELEFVNYIITLEYEFGAPIGAENAIRKLLGRDSLLVTKKSKKSKTGETQVDLIPLIKRVTYEGRRDAITLNAILKAQNPGLNPALIVAAIHRECPAAAPDYVSYHRKQVLDKDMQPFE
jgi:radical SAM-linked protein